MAQLLDLSAHGEGIFTPSDIMIDGNNDLSTSPYVSSGNGSVMNPYIISGIAMLSGSIKLSNTTSCCVMENISFSTGEDYAITLLNTDNIRLSFISVDGRRKVLMADECTHLSIDNLKVVNVTQTGISIIMKDVDDLTIAHSELSVADAGNPAFLIIDKDCYRKIFRNNTLNGFFLNMDKFGSGDKVIESRFINSTFELKNATEGCVIRNNEFRSDLYFGMALWTSLGMLIEKNSFRCVEGIRFFTPVYNYQIKTIVRNNTFESCLKGISVTIGDTLSRLIGWNVYDNYFGNCTDFAIVVGYGYYNIFFRNIFYHNAGTDDVKPGAQVNQDYIYDRWTHNNEGNFWANHRTPDIDGNGIVDTSYKFPVGGEDTHPYSNIRLDRTRPKVSILAPAPGPLNGPYQRITWESSDHVSGISYQRLTVDGFEYNVTGKTLKTVCLEKGNHEIELNVTDGSGLTNMTFVKTTLDQTSDVVSILDPEDQQHINVTSVRINWTVIRSFPVMELAVIVNGVRTDLDPRDRTAVVDLVEGSNTVIVTISDDDGLQLEAKGTIIVDLQPPVIDIICPLPGSYITNELVKFRWSISDANPIVLVQTRLDDEEWITREVDQMNVMTSKGPHVFSIRAFDKAGNMFQKDVQITVGEDPNLKVISPAPGYVTRLSTIKFTWEYIGSFSWTKAFIRVGNSSQFLDIGGSHSFDIVLERNTRVDDEGSYYLTLKLEDDNGNYLEGYTSVIRDNTNPRVVFSLPEDFPNTNRSNVLLKWRGIDEWGISSYSIMINDEEWIDTGLLSQYQLDLEEGEYTIQVRAVDRAGNIGKGGTIFLVDRTPPTLQITAPVQDEMVKSPEVTFRWKVSDQVELSNVTFTLDGASTIDVTGLTMITRSIPDEGAHTVSITAMDTCGNWRVRKVDFTLDITPPEIEWSSSIPVMTNDSIVYLSWSITDLVGLADQKLFIDDEGAEIGVDDRNLSVEFDDGVHTLQLIAIDLAEREVSEFLTIVVDTTPPEILFDPEECTVQDNIARLFWDISDDTSGVRDGSIMGSLDGGPFFNLPLDDRYVTEILPPGDHVLTVKAVDEAGNEARESWEFRIENINDVSDGKGGSSLLIVIGAIGIVMVCVAGAVYFLVIRKGKGKKEGISIINRPERLNFAIPAPKNAGRSAFPPVAQVQALPSKKVEESSIGSGYIRPEKKGSIGTRPSTLKNGSGNVDGPEKEQGPVEDPADAPRSDSNAV